MELREFAENVLFATTLEGKLLVPENITDAHTGTALITPDAPGRPSNLRFKLQSSGKAEFPGLQQLEKQTERGRLLHFFANHELLATELMALVLLKFPDAPAAFRKGVLRTLKDEQEHTRLYLKRMKDCGIEFGELPVSGYFWRCVAPMENPIDYVAGLCLTFEQANLDFARHFAGGFENIGDLECAKLLDKIYRDEIGHVAYGLKWFRRWKNPDESDWAAFCRTLKFPLSPQRAKGFSLNVEARRIAGFDSQFLAELDVYSQSKGRTPSIFVFNPFAEGRIAEGRAFNPTKHQNQLAHDLENLPQFLCRQDDIVLVTKRPSVEFLSRIKQVGFALPEFLEIGKVPNKISALSSHKISEGSKPGDLSALAKRKLGRLRPWAWSPDSVELLAPLFGSVTAEKRHLQQSFNENIAHLYSKAGSAAVLGRLLAGINDVSDSSCSESKTRNWLCSENEIGIPVSSLESALEAIAAIRNRGHHQVVVKQSIGIAGSNALRLFEPEILDAQRRWMTNTFARGQQLIIEPWLERLLDFSVQLEMTTAGLKLCGFTGLLNDAKGQFAGNWAESHHHTRIPARVVALFDQMPDISRRLLQLYARIFSILEPELCRINYQGPLGIDALVYRDERGLPRLKPVVEINPRYTMGRLTVELMRQTVPGSCGLFRLINQATLRKEGFETFASYAKWIVEKFPLKLAGEPASRIVEGALSLAEPGSAEVCLPVFLVSRTVDGFFEKIENSQRH